MADPVNGFDRALAAIRNAHLRYPDEHLLECFLQDAIDPAAAARYMLQRCSVGRDGFDLLPLLSDWKQLVASFMYEVPPYRVPDRGVVNDIWKRDGGKCCITGMKKSLLDPLVVVPILPRTKPIQNSLHEMLGVFTGPEVQQRILSHDGFEYDLRNYWLVRKSAAVAWSQGWFQFTFKDGKRHRVTVLGIGGPVFPPIVDKTPMVRYGSFAGRSASSLDPPDVLLLQAVSRFANPMRWTLVAGEIAKKQSQRQPSVNIPLPPHLRLLSQHVFASFGMVWCLLPITLRIQVYRCLCFLGSHLYEPSCSLKVQRLPFGMYLKTTVAEHHEGLANEYGALQLVRRHTGIPVPRPLDLVSNGRMSYLLTSRLPGLRLGAFIDTLSDDEANMLVCDLQRCVGELRAIPKDFGSQYAISNALGQPCYDFRIIMGVGPDKERGDFIGPFADEDEFNKALQTPALPGVSHRSGHKMVFTHSDLNMRNILMHNGRLSGIVDWENAGWFPEYWDYTKAHFITKLKRRWLRIVDEIFKKFGDYESELETERRFWEYCY